MLAGTWAANLGAQRRYTEIETIGGFPSRPSSGQVPSLNGGLTRFPSTIE